LNHFREEDAMAKMRAVQVAKAGGALELVEREIPEPGPGEVRIEVEACGVCHSDSITKEGYMPVEYPRVPGHEVIGRVDAVGQGVKRLTVGQRVGVGWHGGQCNHCDQCRRGNFFACERGATITGISRDGGYAEYMTALEDGVAVVPDELASLVAALFLCAGFTTFNAIRNCGARPGDLVAILGLGGLGHLGVQFAAKMGFRTVAIARGQDKEALARQLGAEHYIDSKGQDVAKELRKLGRADVVIATVTDGDAMGATVPGLAPNGTLMILGAPQTMTIPALYMITGKLNVRGWYSGTSIDSQDTLAFSSARGVQSMNEEYPLERAAEAYDRMMSGKARFRVVLRVS
jgi:D-arabinose 1-dehydrogenase-like Zn-dependent alcohol dehydrogenase